MHFSSIIIVLNEKPAKNITLVKKKLAIRYLEDILQCIDVALVIDDAEVGRILSLLPGKGMRPPIRPHRVGRH